MYGILISWCLYAAVSGFKDGVLWSRKAADAFTWNEHIIFVMERVLIVVGCLFATNLTIPEVLWTMVCFLLMFSFFHNTAYYYSRAKIDGTKFDIKYSSTTSTAKLEFGYRARLWMAIAGIILLVIGEIYV